MPRPVDNPPNPWRQQHVEWLDEPPAAGFEVFEEQCKSALSHNDSPDLPARWSVNPYRGCLHACAYCYARPSHQYLGFGAGTDFDRKIVVKTNVVDVLRRELSRPRWARQLVMFSGNTDAYQGLEASYRLTRGCLEACLSAETPVQIITKSALVARDVDVLGALARGPGAEVFISLPLLDDDLARALEPYAARPARRLAAMRALADAGVRVGVALAPLIPGLNDDQIPNILRAAHEAGATGAFLVCLRLPDEVAPVFTARLAEALPGKADRVLRALGDVRGGKLGEKRFGARFTGQGPRWDATRQLFDTFCKKLGYETTTERESLSAIGRSSGATVLAPRPEPEVPARMAQPERRQLALFAEASSPAPSRPSRRAFASRSGGRG